jgi:hypothetical protein
MIFLQTLMNLQRNFLKNVRRSDQLSQPTQSQVSSPENDGSSAGKGVGGHLLVHVRASFWTLHCQGRLRLHLMDNFPGWSSFGQYE